MREITKKGYMAEHLVAADLIGKGYIPCMPTIPSSEFDILAVKGSEKLKIQVKSASFKGNKIRIDLRKPKARNRKYTEEDVDVYAIFDREFEKVAYLKMEDYVERSQVTLYLEEPEQLRGFARQQPITLFDECTLTA